MSYRPLTTDPTLSENSDLNSPSEKAIKAYNNSGVATLTNKTIDNPIIQNYDGWIDADETWTYSSVDDPTGVITVPSDATTKYSFGMRISFVNGGNTIYGIVTAVTSTTITFLHEIDPTDSQALYLMANSAITVPRYSSQKAPFGFPMEKTKWSIVVTDSTSRSAGAYTASTYVYDSSGNCEIDVPIGSFDLSFKSTVIGTLSAASNQINLNIALSTSNNSVSDEDLKVFDQDYLVGGNNVIIRGNFTATQSKVVNLTAKDTYYIIAQMNATGDDVSFRNDLCPLVITAVCAYL